MTPRAFEPGLVQAKLHLLDALLDDLEGVGPLDGSRLRADRILRHAVERILTQLVEQAVDVNAHVAATLLGEAPAGYRESFSAAARAGALGAELAAELAPSAGLRNLLVHEYAAIDVDLVARAAGRALPGYRAYVRSVAAFLHDAAR